MYSEEAVDTAVAEFRRGIRREQNFELIVIYFLPQVQRLVRRTGFPEEDRLDLTQEIFLSIYKGLEKFRGEAKVATWVFAIAHHACQTYSKKAQRDVLRKPPFPQAHKGDHDPESPDDDLDRLYRSPDDPLEGLRRKEEVEALRKAIDQLPPEMRRCVRLRIDQDLKYHEIASLLHISVDTVKTQLFNARSRLRTILGDPIMRGNR